MITVSSLWFAYLQSTVSSRWSAAVSTVNVPSPPPSVHRPPSFAGSKGRSMKLPDPLLCLAAGLLQCPLLTFPVRRRLFTARRPSQVPRAAA